MERLLEKIKSFCGKTLISSPQDLKATLTHDSDQISKIGAVCFSKDRPFQLEQFLISFDKYLSNPRIQLVVIVKTRIAFKMIYADIISRHKNVLMIYEIDFLRSLKYSLAILKDYVGSNGYFQFFVDDMIFFNECPYE